MLEKNLLSERVLKTAPICESASWNKTQIHRPRFRRVFDSEVSGFRLDGQSDELLMIPTCRHQLNQLHLANPLQAAFLRSLNDHRQGLLRPRRTQLETRVLPTFIHGVRGDGTCKNCGQPRHYRFNLQRRTQNRKHESYLVPK